MARYHHLLKIHLKFLYLWAASTLVIKHLFKTLFTKPLWSGKEDVFFPFRFPQLWKRCSELISLKAASSQLRAPGLPPQECPSSASTLGPPCSPQGILLKAEASQESPSTFGPRPRILCRPTCLMFQDFPHHASF